MKIFSFRVLTGWFPVVVAIGSLHGVARTPENWRDVVIALGRDFERLPVLREERAFPCAGSSGRLRSVSPVKKQMSVGDHRKPAGLPRS